MIFKNNKQQRGAVTRKGRMPSKPRFHWQVIMPAVYGCLLLLIVAGLVVGVEQLLNKPISKVAVTGELRHVDKKAVVAEVSPFLDQGFVRLDMAAIQEKLQLLPWVYEVRVQRQWPNEIIINVVEQQAIAQWGDLGYLNHRGELFKPQVVSKDLSLPLLIGPEAESKGVMTNYRAIGEMLRRQGLELTVLKLSDRGSWAVELRGGVTINVGRDQLMEKIQRFVYLYKKVLANNLMLAKEIDMRYSNGIAVSWREQS